MISIVLDRDDRRIVEQGWIWWQWCRNVFGDDDDDDGVALNSRTTANDKLVFVQATSIASSDNNGGVCEGCG